VAKRKVSQNVKTPDGAKTALMSAHEIAETLGMSLSAVYARLRDGRIPSRRTGGRFVVGRAEFNRWLIRANARDLISN
jgi:excisionase family DNA binding protein